MKTFFSVFWKNISNVKMKLFKTTVVICIFSLTFSLFSCGEEGINLNQTDGNSTANVVVFSYKDDESSKKAEIKSGLYAFILSDKKTDFLYLLSQYQEQGNSQITVMDNESFWNTVPDKEDGRTYKELVETDIQTYCKRLVITKALCDKYGISVTKNEDTKAEIEASVQNHINKYGDENSLNSYLYRFGITADDLFDYYEMQYLVEALENYYYGNGGKTPIDSSLVNEKFQKDWAKVKYIFISYTNPTTTLPDSDASKDSSSSEEKIEFDGERTKEKVIEYANNLFESIKSGAVTLDEKYMLSEDGVAKHFPNGIIIQRGTSDKAIDEAIFNMNKGDIRLVEADTGVYIISKDALETADINEYYDDIEQTFIDEKYSMLIEEYSPFVSVNNNELKKYDIIPADLYEWGDK